MDMISIAGFDLSLNSTGVAIRFSNKVQTTYRISEKDPFQGTRLLKYFDKFEGIISKNNVKMIIVEGYSFGSPFGRESAGEIGGILKLLSAKHKALLVIVSPSSLKKFVTSKGTGKKDKIRLEAFKRWGVEFETNDEVDAYVLMKIGEGLMDPSTLTGFQKEVTTLLYNRLSLKEREMFEKIRGGFNGNKDV